MERIVAANEVAFRVGFSGYSGHLRLEPLPPVERPNPLSSLPDFILPSAFEPATPDTVKKDLEQNYLVPELDPDEFSPENSGRQWDFDWFDRAKVELEPSLPRSVVVPSWELPFRRSRDGTSQGKWKPISVQISQGNQHPHLPLKAPGRRKHPSPGRCLELPLTGQPSSPDTILLRPRRLHF